MKPYYSIEELAHILHEPIYRVADGLVACGVVPTYGSEPADLSQWASLGPDIRGEQMFINLGEYPVPHPSRVIVNSEVLPQSWKNCISGADSGAGSCGEVQEKPFTTSERDSLLKLVIGMAVKGYSYDPSAKKNTAVADISTDLVGLGLQLSDDTIRKYLIQGVKKLPPKPIKT